VTEIELVRLADRIVPILGFVLCISVVAELADRIGVFAVLADRVAVLARGSVWRLWLLVVILATLATMVLSLDTTAVLVTPVVLALAAQLGLDRMLFAYTAIWLANTASLLLPVSNLTNLLSVRVLGMAAPAFTRLMWPAAMAGIVVTVAALALIFQRSLRGRYTRISNIHFWDRSLLAIAMIVCLALGSLFAIGVNVTYASAVAALVLVVACLLRAPQLLSLRLVPWTPLAGVSALFVGVQVAHDHGLGAVLGVAGGAADEGFTGLLRLTGISALGANLVNNLPAYLAMEPVVNGSALRMAALLVGVNIGPLITPWASLATLLWASRCRAAGIPIQWRTFALRGLIIVPVLIVASVAAIVAAPMTQLTGGPLGG
jgi:arsenical pump membrane protein